MSEETKQPKSTKVEVLEKMSDLATAGLGLVAALAWNEAIKALVGAIFPQPTGGIIVSFVYAIIITAIVVIVTIKLGRLINGAKKKME